MAASQFGFVVSRALAVLSFFYALNYGYMTYGVVLMGGDGRNTFGKVFTVGVLVIFLLMATLLWTGANLFTGSLRDSQPNLRSGNWVVRLAFTALGVLLMFFSLSDFAPLIFQLSLPEGVGQTRMAKLQIGIGAVKFLVGLGIFLAYRFDKAAVVQAAEAIEPANDHPV